MELLRYKNKKKADKKVQESSEPESLGKNGLGVADIENAYIGRDMLLSGESFVPFAEDPKKDDNNGVMYKANETIPSILSEFRAEKSKVEKPVHSNTNFSLSYDEIWQGLSDSKKGEAFSSNKETVVPKKEVTKVKNVKISTKAATPGLTKKLPVRSRYLKANPEAAAAFNSKREQEMNMVMNKIKDPTNAANLAAAIGRPTYEPSDEDESSSDEGNYYEDENSRFAAEDDEIPLLGICNNMSRSMVMWPKIPQNPESYSPQQSINAPVPRGQAISSPKINGSSPLPPKNEAMRQPLSGRVTPRAKPKVETFYMPERQYRPTNSNISLDAYNRFRIGDIRDSVEVSSRYLEPRDSRPKLNPWPCQRVAHYPIQNGGRQPLVASSSDNAYRI